MKAIVYHQYGPPDVLQYADIEKPVPKDNEVLIRIRAASVNPLDWHFVRGTPYLIRPLMMGLRKPKVPRLGVDVAGEVEAVGKDVTSFKPGDAVFGTCRGAFAEYGCAPEKSLATKPRNLTFEQAAAVNVAGFTALQAIRDSGNVQPGYKVLVNGAAGGVGTFAVQIAKHYGAEVTGVCSTGNVEMLRSIGADHVIDYTQEDFTKGTKRYDVILDSIGNHSFSAIKGVLSPKGICVVIGAKDDGTWFGPMLWLFKVALRWILRDRQFAMCRAKGNKADLEILRDLIEAGKITPVIDRRYNLREVPQAIGYVEQGHARGKVVITV